ncbi:VAC8 [Scenedesmus sp. PABB004]|nr:VAC8 [Scenedesmus sp. PABB004]
MSTFWRRHRRKILAVGALGAAGAAAYYWWYSSEEEQQERERQRAAELAALGGITGAGQPARRGPGGAAQGSGERGGGGELGGGGGELDESLAAHFASIQELSDRQALEELLPRLHEVLLAATNYEPLREQLRSPAAAALGSEEKLALWRGLAAHSFVRALGAVWLVPLLDLLVRLKLHIVGRHMYLESRLPQLQPAGSGGAGGLLGAPGLGPGLGGAAHLGRLALPPCLSDRAKEEFFRCDYFIESGAAGLLHRLRAAVQRGLAGVDFGGSMAQQDVEALVITMHAAFEDSFVRAEDLWADYLVPPGPAPVSVRTGAGVEALLSPVEAGMVDELQGELRDIITDFRFVEALRAAVRHASKSMGAYVAAKMGGGGGGGDGARPGSPAGGVRPFPYVVPIVAKSGALLFDEAGRASKGISALREVLAVPQMPAAAAVAQRPAGRPTPAPAEPRSPGKASLASVMMMAEQLAKLDRPGLDAAGRAAAAGELRRHARAPANRGALAGLPGALRTVTALLDDTDAAVREAGAGIVCNLACGHEGNKAALGSHGGALERVCSLLAGPDAGAAATAAAALTNLVHGHTFNQLAVGRLPGALTSLLELLRQPGAARARIAAARALESLAPANQDRLPAQHGAFAGLVAALADAEGAVRSAAAAALGKLAWMHQGNRRAVAAHPGALPGLASLLRDACPRARQQAAAALAHLACCEDDIREAVAATPRALTGLIAALRDGHAEVRLQAAAAIKALAARHVTNQTRIGAMLGALSGLLDLLDRAQPAGVRQQAADALKGLAARHTSNWPAAPPPCIAAAPAFSPFFRAAAVLSSCGGSSMARRLLALASLAVLVGAAAAGAPDHGGPLLTKDGDKYMGLDVDGKPFPGRISHIYCYADPNGMLTGAPAPAAAPCGARVPRSAAAPAPRRADRADRARRGRRPGMAYKNEYLGYKTYCSRPPGGYYGSDCAAGQGCSQLVLGPVENIVRVEACRGGKCVPRPPRGAARPPRAAPAGRPRGARPATAAAPAAALPRARRYGYTSVTFWTDMDRNLTCGSGSYDYAPGDYASYGRDYQTYKWAKDSARFHGRHLLDGAAAGAGLDFYTTKGYGWGWDSKCEVYEAPKKPEWADCGCSGCSGSCDPDWYKHGKGSDKYGYVQNKYGKSWTEYDSYYKHDGADGKKTHYYKDYDNYKKYETACGVAPCDAKPDFYYRQVYPLAGFKVKCSKADDVYDVYKFKWNKKYIAPAPANCLPVKLTIVLAAGVNCADINLAQVEANLTAIFRYLEQQFPDVFGGFSIGNIQCIPGTDGGNATLVVDVCIEPAPGDDVQDLINELANAGISSGTDLCTIIPGGSCEYPIVDVVIDYAFTSLARLQALLVDSQFRAQLARYKTVVGTRRWA